MFIEISNAVIAANPKHTVSAIFSLTLAANAQKTTINGDLSKDTDTHGQSTANKGICINTGGTGPTYPTEPTISIFMSSGVATLSFNDAYFKENSKYLAKGYIEVSNDFAIPEKVASALGLTDTYYVKAGNLAFTKDSSGQ